MNLYKKHPKKPLFADQKEKELFLNLFNDFDEDNYKEIAKLLFCDGMTNEETANITNYSVRHIERLRADLLKVALKRAIKKMVKIGVIPSDN